MQIWAGDGLTGETPADLSTVPQDERPLQDAPPISETAIRGATYDLVLSNIISATLIRLAHDVSASVVPGGGWIVSGIIESNWAEVARAAEAAEFQLMDERREDGWVAARFHRLTIGE